MPLQVGQQQHAEQVRGSRHGDDGGGEMGQDPGRGAESALEVGGCSEEHVPIRRREMLDLVILKGGNRMKKG